MLGFSRSSLDIVLPCYACAYVFFAFAHRWSVKTRSRLLLLCVCGGEGVWACVMVCVCVCVWSVAIVPLCVQQEVHRVLISASLTFGTLFVGGGGRALSKKHERRSDRGLLYSEPFSSRTETDMRVYWHPGFLNSVTSHDLYDTSFWPLSRCPHAVTGYMKYNRPARTHCIDNVEYWQCCTVASFHGNYVNFL